MEILIADDDAVSRRLLEKTLRRNGYEVTALKDGRQAMERLCNPDGPRLALLDWMMPQCDGPTVCTEVRKQRGQTHVHIVLLTSRDSKEDIVTGLESGADDYLVKPFHPEELMARLRAGVRILELEDKLLQAREDLRYKATHDSLTSLLNRGLILEILPRELDRMRTQKSGIAILIGDLDHFKSVNDAYGHLVGDEVLREVGRRLVESVRPYDFVGRYGGEEFLLVITRCNERSVLARAEQIRGAIGNFPIATTRGALPVTISIGIFASHGEDNVSMEEMLREADKALYAAKAAGRNCTWVAGQSAKVPQGS
jgi:two-component system, cell cycle response regulator